MSKSALILETGTSALFDIAVRKAAELLRAGEVVALPTETVYGLAANALDENAVRKIFEAKGRPAHNPIIVHVASLEMARSCAEHWPELARNLAKAFWPGPLTIVLSRAPIIPVIVTAGGPTVGIRWPSHPVIQAVIRECGFPIAAPSANRFSQLSPTTAQHVKHSLGDRIPLIVDGGPAQVGIESTVLDLTTAPPHLLRPGMIHAESLLAVTGKLRTDTDSLARILKSPGQLPKHYAPHAKLVVLSWRDEADLKHQLAGFACPPSKTFILAHSHIPSGTDYVRVLMPHVPQAFARALYAELHQCDEKGAQLIVVEAPPDQPQWQAIKDRLKRAAV